MIGLIDGGGGMRGVYTSGIYDCMLDLGASVDYGIGAVSYTHLDVYKRQLYFRVAFQKRGQRHMGGASQG